MQQSISNDYNWGRMVYIYFVYTLSVVVRWKIVKFAREV